MKIKNGGKISGQHLIGHMNKSFNKVKNQFDREWLGHWVDKEEMERIRFNHFLENGKVLTDGEVEKIWLKQGIRGWLPDTNPEEK